MEISRNILESKRNIAFMVSASGSARTERMQLFCIVAIPVSLHVRVKDKEGIKEPKSSLKMFISLESCHESHQGGL